MGPIVSGKHFPCLSLVVFIIISPPLLHIFPRHDKRCIVNTLHLGLGVKSFSLSAHCAFLKISESNLCYIYTQRWGAIYQRMVDLLRATPLKKTDSSLRNHQIWIAYESRGSWIPLHNHIMLTGLSSDIVQATKMAMNLWVHWSFCMQKILLFALVLLDLHFL